MVIFCLAFASAAWGSTPQTITFPPIGIKSVSAPAFHLGGTASSGLPVSYVIVGGSGLASASGDLITLAGTVGTVTIKAAQSGNGKFEAAPQVYQTFTIVKAVEALPWKSIAAGSLAVRSDGTLWAWGGNTIGQLGDSTTIDRPVPVQIGTASDWKSVNFSEASALAIKTDGSLWAWGSNYYGQLGLAPGTEPRAPVRVGTARDWKLVATGYGETIAIKKDGTLWDWGNGSPTPVQVGTANTWKSIAASYSNLMAIKTDGTLWGWGDNYYGQLADGTLQPRYSPNLMIQIGTSTQWKEVSVGTYFALGLKTDGTLWSWGINNQNELGDGTSNPRYLPGQIGTASDWKTISAGNVDSVAIKTDGSLWAWGDNQLGEVGDGTATPREEPVRIGVDTDWQMASAGSFLTIATKSDGSIWVLGQQTFPRENYSGLGRKPIFESHNPVTAFSSGESSFAIRSDGSLWAWGANRNGQLGGGANFYQHEPIQISSSQNWKAVFAGGPSPFGIQKDGTLWGWGYGNRNNIELIYPHKIGSSNLWRQVSSGSSIAGTMTDGTLWVWQDGSDLPQQFGTARDWRSVSSGGFCTLAIKTDGTLWVWGFNNGGVLGLDSTHFHEVNPVQVGNDNRWQSLSVSDSSVVALKTDGTLWAWGHFPNSESVDNYLPRQLGLAADWKEVFGTGVSLPTKKDIAVALKKDGTLWRWQDWNTVQQVAPGAKWSALPTGATLDDHFLAATADGTLWSFGQDSYNRPPDVDYSIPRRLVPGSTAQSLTFPPVTAMLSVPVTLQATATSGLPVIYRVSGPAKISGNQLIVYGAGEVNIVAYQPGDSYWDSTGPISRSLNLRTDNRFPQSISFPNVPTQHFRGPPVTLSAVASTGLPVEYTVLSGPGSLAGNSLTLAGIGQVVVQALQIGNTEYRYASAVIKVNASKVLQTITFPAVSGPALGPLIPLEASASSGLPITYSVLSGPGTLKGSSLFPRGAGIVTVQASQAGNDEYAAVGIHIRIALSKMSQTVTFPAVSGLVQQGPPATLQATASSGLPLVYRVLSGPGTVSGKLLTATGAGVITVQASQAGDSNYTAAGIHIRIVAK